MFKIHEKETNVTYDDLYATKAKAEEVINWYKLDDQIIETAGDGVWGVPRKITYEIITV